MRTKEEIYAGIKEILQDQLRVSPEEIVPEAEFIGNLGADSLDLVEIVMAMEDKFGLDVSDEDAERLQTVGDAIEYILTRSK